MDVEARYKLSLFGPSELIELASGETIKLRPQLKKALAILALEGGESFKVADDRLADFLWSDSFQRAGNLNGLFGDVRKAMADFDPEGNFVVRDRGVTQLVGLVVDAVQFNDCRDKKAWDGALQLAERGLFLDGFRSAHAEDWVDRTRRRFGISVEACFLQSALQLTAAYRQGRADYDDVVRLALRRERSAIDYDLNPELIKRLSLTREKLQTLENEPGLELLPKHAEDDVNHAIKRRAERLIVERMGSGASLTVDPDHIDSTHRFTRVVRTDLLDYQSGDFFSLRRLVGVNVADTPSEGLVYAESSEAKLAFSATETKAFETETRRPLLVEPLIGDGKPRFQHGFRVFFREPVDPGASFDITYAIRLPGELKVLSPDEEMMSIALVRWKHPVGRLEFNVVLNYEPLRVTAEELGHDGEFAPLDARPSPTPYVPTEWYELDFDLPWSASPHVVSCVVDEPTAPMYVLRYRI